MKKTKRFTAILLAAVLLGGCGQEGIQPESKTEELSAGRTDESANEAKEPKYIDGFEVAEYEKFNSYASDNGLGETKVYVSGIIGETFSYSDAMGICLIQEDGKKWAVNFCGEPNLEIEESLKGISGKEIEVFGEYTGYTATMKMPVIKIYSTENDYYVLVDGEKMIPDSFMIQAGFTGKELQNFSSDFQSFKNWFSENANECVYSERGKDGNTETYNISTGVVSDSSSVIEWIDFIQKAEDGYSAQSADTKGIILENSNKFSDFQDGDGIKIYYYINADNETEILAMEKIEPEFTIEDYVNAYKEQCKEYTYKEIARNPDSVKGEYAKLMGEVIQVLESGNSVTLRVDITKSEYGYYSDTVYVTYTKKSETEDRILEDDIILIYGKLGGIETYTSVLGAEVSLPKIFAEYIELVEE